MATVLPNAPSLMMSGTLLPARILGTLVCSVLKSWPTTLTVTLGYFASNSDPSFWKSGTSIDASSTLIVTLALPTAVPAGDAELALPLDGPDQDTLDAVLDEVRARYGAASITRAVLIGRRRGFTMPLLPD